MRLVGYLKENNLYSFIFSIKKIEASSCIELN